jgi:hypothetical protein
MLADFDFYPASSSVPVVSDRMKEALLSVCQFGEIAFHPCFINGWLDERMTAWNFFPLHRLEMVNRERSIIRRDDYIPNHIDFTDHLVLVPNCLRSLNIARMAECGPKLFVSDKFKATVEACNGLGAKFVRPKEVVIGFP